MEPLEFTRYLRENQTKEEKIVWELIRKKQILGYRFLRQYKIEYSNIIGARSYFISDFYCHQLKLIIEIDGEIHKEQIEYDQYRDKILNEMGYKILRITNDKVISFEAEAIIKSFIKNLPTGK